MAKPTPEPGRPDAEQEGDPLEGPAPEIEDAELITVNPPSTHDGPFLEHTEEGAIFRIWAQASFSGPLPPPSILEDYNRAHPGASDIIIELAQTELTMAIAEQRHRHDLESREINAAIELARRGQRYAAAIAGSCIVLGALVMVVGMLTNQAGIAVTGAGLILGVVVALTVVFVTGRESQAKAQPGTERSRPDTPSPGDGEPTS